MIETVNWLHLTDLHFGGNKAYLWPRLKHELFSDLRKRGDAVGPFDIVFFTGDFVQSGKKEEFEKLTVELVELWDVLGRLGKKPILCPVPGNHDLSRPLPTDLVSTTLKHWWDEPDVRAQFWCDAAAPLRKEMAALFRNYQDWIAAIPIPLPTMTKGILPGDFSATIVAGTRKVGVIGLNTAFLQIAAGEFEGKLDVHASQLLAVCQDDADHWLREHDIGLLLTHHPINWLYPATQSHFRADIYPSDRFHAALCGHQHAPAQTEVSEGGSSPRRFRQGPSLFGLEKFGNTVEQQRRHGYNAGQFEFDGNRGVEKIWPREAITALSGDIRLRPDQRYDLTEDNCVVSAFDANRDNGVCDKEQIDISAQTSGIVPSGPAECTTEPQLGLLDQVPDLETATKWLAACARFAISSVPQHSAVRLDEQSQFENTIRQDRIVWVTSNWATGIDGFLSASFERFRKQPPEPTVFHLHCDEASDTDQFEALFVQQFGMSMQRFCALLVPLPTPFLLLADLPSALVGSAAIVHFKRIIAAILEYCPNLRIVVTSLAGPQTFEVQRVDLRPLDPPDVRTYLLNHPDATSEIRDPDAIEKIHERSDGLPVHIDRILRALKVSSLESVLEAEFDGIHSGELALGDVPKALVQAIDSLAASQDRQSQRSLRLLKVLSVLPYGETIEGMKRYLPTEPFYINNAVQLNELGLLDVIPLCVPALQISMSPHAVSEHAGPKLLKIPRQVRDYVQSLLTECEREDFISAGADLYFGHRWRNGKINPRSVPVEYREFLDNRPGNEFAVIHHLLHDSKTKDDISGAKRAAGLAVYYCRALRSKERYRDLVIVAGGILQVADVTMIPDNWAEIAYLYGLALRMTGKTEIAVTYLHQILGHHGIIIDEEVKAAVWLNISMGEETLRHTAEAISAAKEVKRLSKEKSTHWFQANCIIEGLEKSGKERVRRLSELAQEARSRGMTAVANNLALDLAYVTKDPHEKSKLLDTVLVQPGDSYNKTRAIAEKTKSTEHSSVEVPLTANDLKMLSEAYSYAHSQRFATMFDTCHDGMWKALQEKGDMQQLLRLFRHSSFIWRIRGEEGKESEYAQRLSTLKPPDESVPPPKFIVLELSYFWNRFRRILPCAKSR